MESNLLTKKQSKMTQTFNDILATLENIEGFKDEIKKLVLRGQRIEGTYRKGEPDQFSAIHFYDSLSGCNAIFKQETKEFVSAWKLTQGQVSDLLDDENKNIGDY
jgi:hypothetical protein